MKLSVSIPDELWAAVRKVIPLDSPSELVQEALRRVCPAGAADPDYAQAPGPDKELEEAFAAAEEHQLNQARELYQSGYRKGLALGAVLRWESLRRIIRTGLRDAASNRYRCLHDIAMGAAPDGVVALDPELDQYLGELSNPSFPWSPSDIVVDGMERALKDLWARINSTSGTSTSEHLDQARREGGQAVGGSD